MKRLLVPCLVLSVLMLAPPAAGQEVPPPTECGGTWQADVEQCSFVYQGGSVNVWLWLVGEPAGAAVVRLEAPGVLPEIADVLLTCEAVGFFSACGASMTSTEDIAPIGSQLTCIVEGRAAHGTYGCSSSS
jgi:hypothetical protein